MAVDVVGMGVYTFAISMGVVPGLAERMALMAFMIWEIWAYAQLISGKPAQYTARK